MEPRYATLKTIYDIVKNESSPTTYHCTHTQVILRQSQPWDIIIRQLDELENEELITIDRIGKAICITPKGVEKLNSPELIIYS